MDISPVTRSSTLPVSVADVKAHLRLSDDSEDAQLTDWIGAAAALWESQTGHVLTPGTFLASFDPGEPVRIPRRPVNTIDAVRLTSNGTTTTVTGWTAELFGDPVRVFLPAGACGAVEIDFSAGHDAPADIPAMSTTAIKLLVAHWYRCRESHTADDLREIPMGWGCLVQQFTSDKFGGF